jgi:type IV pilus assembly protein PilW
MQHLKLDLVSVRRRLALPRLGRRQRGMTLIEWMISITIGLILLVGLAALIAQQSRTQAELDKSSRQIENGRYAMQLLQDDIQLAGYYGEYSTVSSLVLPATLPNPCSVMTADPTDPAYLAKALPFPIQGYDAPTALPADLSNSVASGGCGLNAANYLEGTDILVVRRVDTEVAGATLKPGEVYFQSGLTPSTLIFNFVLAAASSSSVDTAVFNLRKKEGTTAPLRRYLTHIYFISPCSVPANGSTCSTTNTDDGGVSVPTLKRLELSVASGAAKFALVPLVEGIENMQIDYGFDANDTTADGAPDSFAKDAAAVSAWADVMAVRLNLLARNNERSGDHVDTKTYNLGLAGTTAAANDNFKRKVFSQLIRVTNPSSRREK